MKQQVALFLLVLAFKVVVSMAGAIAVGVGR